MGGMGGGQPNCAGGMHRGHAMEQRLMQPGERESTESFLEEVAAGIRLEDSSKIMRETKWGNALMVVDDMSTW